MNPTRRDTNPKLKLTGSSPRSLGSTVRSKKKPTLSKDMLTIARPTKRCILAQLGQKPRTLAELAKSCHRSQSTINKALKSLTDLQLVQPAAKIGRKNQYQLASRIKVTVRGQYADFDVHAPSGLKGRLQVSCKIR